MEKIIKKDDIRIAIKVLNYKMSILSHKFRNDTMGWTSENAYIKWHTFKKARDQLRR